MSFKTRERKRTKRIAVTAAQTQARRSGSSSARWYLTIVSRDTCCARCAGMLRVGREMVYRATPREALCPLCAELDPTIRPRPSVRWERWRLAKR